MAELVEGLTRAFPRRHHLLFADFDSLPPPTLKDGGEEAEAAQRQGENVDGSEMAWLETRSIHQTTMPVCETDLHALNAPLVTSRDPQTGEHVDHPSYVVNKVSRWVHT